MEPVRNWLKRGEPVKHVSDEEIFTEEISMLLEPHLNATIQELQTEERNEIKFKTEGDFSREVQRRLLSKFFKLAQTDKGLNKFMIPIMMYLRSARMKRGVK